MTVCRTVVSSALAASRRDNGGWSAEEWRVFFDERAGFAEFDGGLPRADAEARAFACCIVEWLAPNASGESDREFPYH